MGEKTKLDIALMTVSDVVKSTAGNTIEFTKPIQLFGNEAGSQLPPPPPPPDIPVSLEVAPSVEIAPSIEISSVAQAEVPPAPPVAIELSPSAEEPPPAPESPPALELQPSQISISSTNTSSLFNRPLTNEMPVVSEAPAATSIFTRKLLSTASAPVQEVQAPSEVVQPVSEAEAAKELPYLFGATVREEPKEEFTPIPERPKIEINTGGPISNDIETLKEYLTMREQDVSVLTVQLTYAKEKLQQSEETIRKLQLQNEDLVHQADFSKKKIGELERDIQNAGKSMESELSEVKQDLKSKIDRIRSMESKLSDSNHEYESLKERVRIDIRKIRVREKELENKLEIIKRDSETLIAGRENKILELKRKIDLLEFNYDSLQDQNELEKENVKSLEDKLNQIHKVLKLAMGMIESTETKTGTDLPRDKRAS